MNIASITQPSVPAVGPGRVARPADAVDPGMRKAFADLGQALRASDAEGARAAYAEMVRNAPPGTTWPKDSAFAELGRSLLSQDLQGARQAYADIVRNALATVRPQPPGVPAVPSVPAATASSTGGVAGTLVSVSA